MFAFVKEPFLFLGCTLIFYNKYFTVYLNVHCNEILSNRIAFSLLNILLLLLPKNTKKSSNSLTLSVYPRSAVLFPYSASSDI